MEPSDPQGLAEEVRRLLSEGRKIEAIKVYREATGARLAKAKAAVEAIERGEGVSAAGPVDADLERRLLDLLHGGHKIEAIKVYRERTGARLKDAKDAVEALATRHGLARSGCLGLVLVVVFTGALILAQI